MVVKYYLMTFFFSYSLPNSFSSTPQNECYLREADDPSRLGYSRFANKACTQKVYSLNVCSAVFSGLLVIVHDHNILLNVWDLLG